LDQGDAWRRGCRPFPWELWRWTPQDTPLFLARTDPVPMRGNLDMVSALGDPTLVADAARQLCASSIASLLYACTACTFVDGPAGEAAIAQSLSAVATARSGPPLVPSYKPYPP
jgi:maleate isomerase